MTEASRSHLEALANAVTSRKANRTVIAIAGAPGSGKSTFAERLEAFLNTANSGSAAVLPMDGYHFDDGVLIARGLRARKGAPETFDVGGLLHTLGRLKRNEEDEIAVPVFDRGLEISRAGARLIPQSVRYLIVEGNYLLLGSAPWTALHPLYDVTVAVVVPEDVLRQRLTERWRGYGLPPEVVTAKVETNDLPNGRFVMERSLPAEFVVSE
ncbi:nucleoside/nucleotide kinase family protein [Lichenifustis flavocetrariae]|uniref:Nucleoside/nucleotide kinase family protein n=1 Tax=Lichenifustis flavocetrariae TaxID=2949735 RepID=A0AA41YXU0_9HYPH|nr:nucleoside/nucleotide kinase family protein [Lichenifustis flavocetrariae]MCW6509187.1 nucleoside/nucleotide kinase family protein [Lichenifustis flavocetrariae]